MEKQEIKNLNSTQNGITNTSGGTNQVNVISINSPEQVNAPFPELVPSYYSWILPQQQVEKANKLANITDTKIKKHK